MVKKKVAKKAASARGRKQSKRAAERVLRKGPIRRKPRLQPLPGMEDARIRALDDICNSIAENREQKNELRAEEADLLKTALPLMRQHGKQSWRHGGVELVRVPGEEVLRVRTSKEKATAETEDEDDTKEVFAEDADPDDQDKFSGSIADA